MRLGQGDACFRLEIVGYQFPALQADDWLMIKIDVHAPEGAWQCTCPVLETHDLRRIATWLEAVAAGAAANERLEFMEQPSPSQQHMNNCAQLHRT